MGRFCTLFAPVFNHSVWVWARPQRWTPKVRRFGVPRAGWPDHLVQLGGSTIAHLRPKP